MEEQNKSSDIGDSLLQASRKNLVFQYFESSKKMLESRPEDALVKLVKLVNFVKLVNLVKLENLVKLVNLVKFAKLV